VYIVLCLFYVICIVVVLYCLVVYGYVCMCGFCNVWARAWLCVGFVMCGCFGNMYITTLNDVFPCFFLSCKANARVKLAKYGARPALFQNFCVVLSIVSFVSFCVLFVCKCVLYYCHRVATQLQLTNISYHISFHII